MLDGDKCCRRAEYWGMDERMGQFKVVRESVIEKVTFG